VHSLVRSDPSQVNPFPFYVHGEDTLSIPEYGKLALSHRQRLQKDAAVEDTQLHGAPDKPDLIRTVDAIEED